MNSSRGTESMMKQQQQQQPPPQPRNNIMESHHHDDDDEKEVVRQSFDIEKANNNFVSCDYDYDDSSRNITIQSIIYQKLHGWLTFLMMTCIVAFFVVIQYHQYDYHHKSSSSSSLSWNSSQPFGGKNINVSIGRMHPTMTDDEQYDMVMKYHYGNHRGDNITEWPELVGYDMNDIMTLFHNYYPQYNVETYPDYYDNNENHTTADALPIDWLLLFSQPYRSDRVMIFVTRNQRVSATPRHPRVG